MGLIISHLVKFTVGLVNLAFFLVGAAVMSFGIVVLANPTLAVQGLNSIPGFDQLNYILDIQQALLTSGIVLTVIGSIIMLISFFGLLSACCECAADMTRIIYSILMVLTILLELAFVIYDSVEHKSMQYRIEGLMHTSLVNNFQPVKINNGVITNSTNPAAAAWEALQFKYACCGAYNSTDYSTFPWAANYSSYQNATVPPSCCAQIVQFEIPTVTSQFANLNACMSSPPNQLQYMNSEGCGNVIMIKLGFQAYIVIIIFASLVALEVLILLMTLCIDKHKSNSKEVSPYY